MSRHRTPLWQYDMFVGPRLATLVTRFGIAAVLVLFCAYTLLTNPSALRLKGLLDGLIHSGQARQNIAGELGYVVAIALLFLGCIPTWTLVMWGLASVILLIEGHSVLGWLPIVTGLPLMFTDVMWGAQHDLLRYSARHGLALSAMIAVSLWFVRSLLRTYLD